MNGLQIPPGYEEVEKKKVFTTPLPKIPSPPPGYEDVPEGYEEVSKLKFQTPALIHQKLTPPSKYKRESVFEIPARGQKASNIVYQAARGLVEEAYLNIPKFPKPTELTEWENIFEGAGRFTGFIFGMPMKMGKMGTQLLFKALKKPGKKIASKLVAKKLPYVGRLLARVGSEATQLGLASAVSDIEDVKGMPERFKSGAAFGAIFGGMRWVDIKKMPLLSQILRQVGTRSLARTAHLYKMPYEDIEQWTTPQAAQRVFDEALFSWFSARGAKPAEIFRDLRQIQKEAVRSKLPVQVWNPYTDPTARAAMEKVPAKFISLPSGEVLPAEMFSWKLDVTGIKKILPTLKALPEYRKPQKLILGEKPTGEIKPAAPQVRTDAEIAEQAMAQRGGRYIPSARPEVKPRPRIIKEYPERYIEEQNKILAEKRKIPTFKEFEEQVWGKPKKEPPPGYEEPLPTGEALEAEVQKFIKAGGKIKKVKKGTAIKEPKELEGITEFYGGFDVKKMLENLETTLARKHEAAIEREKLRPAAVQKPMEEPALPVPATPVDKIITALKVAKPLRRQQEALYTEERGKRFAEAWKTGERVTGETGFYAEKARLKGELPKVEFEPVRDKLTQEDIDIMFKQVADSPTLDYLETFPAREGLAKLLGKYGGKVPTEKELALLNRVFGKELTQAVMSKRSLWEKIKSGMLEAANVPRALMASYDLSFGLRQGIFTAARYPKQFASSFIKQFRLFGSEKAFNALKEEIANRPTHKLMMGGRRKLALTEIDSLPTLREEAMMGAAWAEKIPIVGRGVRASARAYTGFANKLRADIFDYMIKSARKAGRNPEKEPQLIESIVDFVNAGTGRGSIGSFERAAVVLNATLFSPRLIASRLSLLNPRFYYKLDPLVRKQALQSLFAFSGMVTTVLGTAKLAGLEVSANPFSADFGKIKIGNTRIDIMGGFQQYIRTAAQFLGGKTVSTTTGKVTKVGKGYKPLTRLDIVGRGLEYKLAPVASFAVSLLRGRSTFGEPIKIPEEIGKRFVPMVIQDVIDLVREDPELLPLASLGFFGVGLQSYGAKKEKPQK